MRYKVTRTRTQNQHLIVDAGSASGALRRAELDAKDFSCSIPLGTDEWTYSVERVGP